jgi:hypothetical protein
VTFLSKRRGVIYDRFEELNTDNLSFRAIEAILFQWAEAHPFSTSQMWLTNKRTGKHRLFFISSDLEGHLQSFSLTDLREARREVDQGADWSAYRVYEIAQHNAKGVTN